MELSNRSASPRWLSARERPYELRAQPMILLAAAAALGILADRTVSSTMGSGVIAVALVGWASVALQRNGGWTWVMLAVFLAMALHSRADQRRFEQASLTEYVSESEQPVLLRAVIRGDVQRLPSRKPRGASATRGDPLEDQWQTKLIIDTVSIRFGSQWQDCSGGVHVTVDDDASELAVGDRIEIGGDIAAFSAPSNPGESDFRYVARNRGLHARLWVASADHVKLLQAGRPSLRRFADSLARHGERTLKTYLGEDVGPLASALVVGRRGSLDAPSKDRLLETGTIHLLSVSGLHLGIVAMTMMSLSVMLGLGRGMQIGMVATACFLFAAITGGQPPVLRAAILVATVLTSLMVNRRQWPLNTLAFAALILLMLNPTNLTQVGVQLSFISVATLVCAARSSNMLTRELASEAFDARPQIEALIDKTRSPRSLWMKNKFRQIRDLAWMSLCVTLTTAPLTWLHFNLISPIAVVANLLLSIPAAIALMSGLIAVVCGWIWQPLAMVPAWFCDWVLRLMRIIIDTASEVPFGHAWLPAPPPWWVASYFLLLIGSFAIKRRFNRPRAFVVGSLAWCSIAWVLAVSPSWRPRQELVVTFVDVGHGTSALLELPSGPTFLYDCGRLGNFEQTSRGIEDVLWSRGLTGLDAIILSHADSDHYNALPGLLDRFHVSEIITPPGLFGDPAIASVLERVLSGAVRIREVSNEDGFLDADQVVQILHPPTTRLPGSDNANSLVIRIDHSGRSFLLPGDLEPPGTEALIELPRLIPGGVLMAPHHGSLTANAQSILDWARPSEVIVSGGARATRPEVEHSLQTRGSNVSVTASDGAIRVIIHGDRITVQHFLSQPW